MKIGTENLEETLAYLQQTFKEIAPDIPTEYYFLDDSFNALYESEQRLGQAFNIFTFLAIFIACVGLFGLISHSVVQRSKEIGIRKVLGASEASIVRLLSKDFLQLVIISVLISIPTAWYLMIQWLNGFAYRIEINWWVFLLAGLSALGVAFLTVSWQSFRAATANPIDTLKQE